MAAFPKLLLPETHSKIISNLISGHTHMPTHTQHKFHKQSLFLLHAVYYGIFWLLYLILCDYFHFKVFFHASIKTHFYPLWGCTIWKSLTGLWFSLLFLPLNLQIRVEQYLWMNVFSIIFSYSLTGITAVQTLRIKQSLHLFRDWSLPISFIDHKLKCHWWLKHAL